MFKRLLSLFTIFAIAIESSEMPHKEMPYSLQDHLLSLDKNSLESSPLWQVHSTWIQNLFNFVTTYEQASIAYPNSKEHPIHHFDQNDAEQFIRPLLKNIYDFELTDELIDRLFFETITPSKDTHQTSPIEKLRSDRFKEETFKIAQLTFELIKGNTLFVLGQTPAYLGEMVSAIDADLSGGSQILPIPFSGRPNYTRNLNYKKLWSTAFLDIITPKGRSNFLSLLQKQHFSPLQWQANPKEIFLVDNSSGASVSCFLALLKERFEEENVPFPRITFLEMCHHDDLCQLTAQQKWQHVEKPDLKFNDTTHFDIPVIYLGMQEDILIAFDKLHDDLRIVPSFNALYWSKDFQSLFAHYPTPEAQKLMHEYRTYALTRLHTHLGSADYASH